jgi:hypothetical protein
MITYLSNFKRKPWKDLTPAERIMIAERQEEVMSDPDTKAAHASMKAHFADEKKKKEKILKLRNFLLARRGLPVTV